MAAQNVGERPMGPALQVIVLGAGGGPLEHNVTALLVRSLKAGWARGSTIAIDAGVHLSAIVRILEATQPGGLGTNVQLPHTLQTGPFSGMELQFASAEANASHISRHMVDSVLVTHPHLDHIAGFVINTAGPPGLRPKRVAGLPSTIAALKTHVFNNVIWPNLTDENNGAGLVTFMRLVEGGSPAIGEGDGKGYLEISDGLSVKLFGVSHGHCIEKHTHRGSASSSRFGSADAGSLPSPRVAPGSNAASGPSSYFRSSTMGHASSGQERESICVYDSSAYFIRDGATGREVLIFGDVEPDSISLSPRNLIIWQEAAPRFVKGNLNAIFIECSYDDSQPDDRLFGHLTPRYVIQEMKALATQVEACRRQAPPKLESNKKRKREANETPKKANKAPATTARPSGDEPVSPKSVRPTMESGYASGAGEYNTDTPHLATPTAEMNLGDFEASVPPNLSEPQTKLPLKGLKVVIIHVKENLKDGRQVRDNIIQELQDHEEEAQLGCEFIVSRAGQSFML
ncbi:cAMP phosphodiesterases class-II-domain-containing protein [Xylariomycetidae sp. FL2044]|nr:cAMP phosphodiesterases class-II-domain-containing protein [Xylariomycetidae sp. FL2044]